jgi:DNA invertase Pin-like site-specific DNA recombinase
VDAALADGVVLTSPRYKNDESRPFLGFLKTGTSPERDHTGYYGPGVDARRRDLILEAKDLKSKGHTYREIAKKIGISLGTVSKYLRDD